MPTNYLPALSGLISFDDLPSELEPVKQLSSTVLDGIFYQNHRVLRGADGIVHHWLTLVFEQELKLDLFGTGAAVVVAPANGAASATSEIDVELSYRWPILKYLGNLSRADFPSDPLEAVALLLDAIGISLVEVLRRLGQIHLPPSPPDDPLAALVAALNSYYDLYDTAGELQFANPSAITFTDIVNGLTAAGITIESVISDFDLTSDYPGGEDTAETILARIAVPQQDSTDTSAEILAVANFLNQAFASHTPPLTIGTTGELDYDGIMAALDDAGITLLDLVTEFVVDDSSVETAVNSLLGFIQPADGYVPKSWEELLVPVIRAAIFDPKLALEFPRSILVPLDASGQPLPDPATSRLVFQLPQLVFATEQGFATEGDPSITFAKSEILNTGLTLEFSQAKLDLSTTSNIPEADEDERPATFTGVFIPEAAVGLPRFWTADSAAGAARIIGQKLLIGNEGGFSGRLFLDTSGGPSLGTTLPAGIKASLDGFEMVIDKNEVTSSQLSGQVVIPALKDAAGADASMAVAGNYAADGYKLAVLAALPPLQLSSLQLTLTAFAMKIARDGSVSAEAISGSIVVPGLSDGTGAPAEIDFTVAIAGDDISVQTQVSSASPVGVALGPIALCLRSFAICLSKTGIKSTDIAGVISIPAVKDKVTGNPAAIAFTVAAADQECTIAAASTPTLALSALDIGFSKFSITLDKSGIKASDIAGAITIPAVKDKVSGNPASIGFTFTAGSQECTLAVANFPALELSAFDLGFNKFAMTLDKAGIKASDIAGAITIPAVKDKVSGNPASIGFTFTAGSQECTLAVTSFPALALGAFDLAFSKFSITLDQTGINATDIAGTITIPAVKEKASGNPAAIGFTFVAEDGECTIATAGIPPLALEAFDLGFSKFSITLDKSGIKASDIVGTITIPALKDKTSGSPAAIGFSFVAGNQECTITATNIPQLALGAFELGFSKFSITLDQTGIKATDISGTIVIPQFKDEAGNPASANFAITAGAGVFTLAATNITGLKLKLGEFDIALTKFSISCNSSGISATDIAGTLTIPGLTDKATNRDVELVFGLALADKTCTIDVANVPPLSLGSIDLALTRLHLVFDDTGIDFNKSSIAGTMQVPAFQDDQGRPIDIKISIRLENGFTITAEALPPMTVLDLKSVVKLELKKLGVSKRGPKWGFSYAGSVITQLSIPGVDAYIPKQITINDFAFDGDQVSAFDLAVEWTGGLALGGNGTGGLSIYLPISKSIGGVASLDGLSISASKTTSGIAIEAVFCGATLSFGGVVTGTVEGLGLRALVQPKSTMDGNVGPLDISLGIVGPKGIAVAFNNPVVSGGGYLMFDSEHGRYAGAIELSIKDKFRITAIGLLNTILPDGSKGVSILLIITVELPTPIPLVYNFYLAAVGGLAGLDRTANIDALRSGVQTGAIEAALFPKDIIKNIVKIVSDLDAMFPPARGHFLVGPMVKITWSNPPLVSVEIGILLELGKSFKFAILGVLRCTLPTEDEALIVLQVAFLGVLDLDRSMIAFDASIFGSRILEFTIEGDMALRLCWGEQKEFLLSSGGFHPSYKPPKFLALPNMKRMAINFFTGNPRLVMQSYFAITTNTVQFGAALDFSYSLSKFRAVAFFSLDVLFQFSPFYFIASVKAGIAILLGDSELFVVALSFSLEGPTPWKINGTAEFKVLFFSYSVQVSETFGEEKEVILPDIQVRPLLSEALAKQDNWQAELAGQIQKQVRLRTVPPTSDHILLQAGGTLTVTQNVVPLDLQMTQFGNCKPADINRASITKITIGGDQTAFDIVSSYFAPASVRKMSDQDKLKAPAYESMHSGVQVREGVGGLRADLQVPHLVEYEVVTCDLLPNPGLVVERQPGLQTYPKEMFEPFIPGGAVGNCALSKARRDEKRYQQAKGVAVDEDRFAVVYTATLKAYSQELCGITRAEADDGLSQQVAANASLAGMLRVIPEYEVVQ